MSNPVTAAVAAAIVLSGCAKSASNVTSAYQSPSVYANWTCDQLAVEELEVRRRVVAMAQKQDNAATRDAVAMGVGLVLFWPALFLLAAGDEEAQLSVIKGQHDALVSAQGAQQCPAVPSAEIDAVTAAASTDTPTTPPATDGAYRPTVTGPRPVEGTKISAFSDDEINAYCGQKWEERQAADGRTEFNPCHRKDAFL
jgi:hypothetical protein